jgi:hypothetical protein
MLSYHLSYFQVLKTTGLYLFLPSLVLFGLLVLSWIVQLARHQKKHGPVVLLAILTALTVVFSLALPLLGTQGAGWSLNGSVLTVRSGSGATAVNIASAKAHWVSKAGPYALKSKITGTSAGPSTSASTSTRRS